MAPVKRGRPRTVADDAVLDAAARAIAAAGPSGVTLAGVAAECGLAPATLVQRFGSKRGLIVALVERGVAQVAGGFEAARGRDPLERLHAALRSSAGSVSTREAMARQIGVLQMDLEDPELGRLAAAHARAFRAEILALLREAECEGLIERADVALARAVHAAYNGALITWALDGEGTAPRRLREAVDAVLSGARRAPGTRPAGGRSRASRR